MNDFTTSYQECFLNMHIVIAILLTSFLTNKFKKVFVIFFERSLEKVLSKSRCMEIKRSFTLWQFFFIVDQPLVHDSIFSFLLPYFFVLFSLYKKPYYFKRTLYLYKTKINFTFNQKIVVAYDPLKFSLIDLSIFVNEKNTNNVPHRIRFNQDRGSNINS